MSYNFRMKKDELMQILQECEGQFVGITKILDKESSNAIDIKPLSTHFFVEMESYARYFPSDGTKDGIKDGLILNKSQKAIIWIIGETPDITLEALAERMGISVRNTEKNVAKLKEKGILFQIKTFHILTIHGFSPSKHNTSPW